MATEDVVRARRVEIVDDQNRVVITLGLLGEGHEDMFGLRVDEPYGRAWIDVVVDGFTSVVSLGSRGDVAAVISVDGSGEAHLYLNDRPV